MIYFYELVSFPFVSLNYFFFISLHFPVQVLLFLLLFLSLSLLTLVGFLIFDNSSFFVDLPRFICL